MGNLFQTLVMSMHKTTLAPEKLLRSVHIEKSYLGKGRLPGVVQRVTRLSKLPQGKKKNNSCEQLQASDRVPCTEAELTPGSVSCPRAMSCPGIM